MAHTETQVRRHAPVERSMSWKKLLESVSASLNDHMRLRNDYLMAENRILRHQMNGRVQLTDHERQELAALGHMVKIFKLPFLLEVTPPPIDRTSACLSPRSHR